MTYGSKVFSPKLSQILSDFSLRSTFFLSFQPAKKVPGSLQKMVERDTTRSIDKYLFGCLFLVVSTMKCPSLSRLQSSRCASFSQIVQHAAKAGVTRGPMIEGRVVKNIGALSVTQTKATRIKYSRIQDGRGVEVLVERTASKWAAIELYRAA